MAIKHPNAEDPKHPITWTEYMDLISKLVQEIKASGKTYKYIHGVPRGGLIPAVIISHVLGLKLVLALPLFRRGLPTEEVLIVDDLADTGRTFEYYKEFDTAALYVKPWSTVIPTYFVEQTNKWVVFPYEI